MRFVSDPQANRAAIIFMQYCEHPPAIKMMAEGQEETGNHRRHQLHTRHFRKASQ
jgi:hypothetical protein